ncbi:MAG: DUF188 domain-containing protein [Treponema sp.]|nr:DUF188 domain-containing protein [Treponema sp.]
MAARILVDADSCPQRVRKYLLARAKKNPFELYFVANKEIKADDKAPAPANFKMIVCPKEEQAADNWILQNAKEGDLAITRDIPLAAALLQKNIRVLNDLGKIFDKKNIERALKERELNMQMSQLGLGTKKRDTYGQKEFELFAETFNTEIQKILN